MKKHLSLSSASIKLIAVATMFLDHVGMLFFPEGLILRIVGRLSFPLFAFLIAEGFEKTSDVKRYLGRLVTFAVVSQIPYSIFLQASGLSPARLNIFFTLAAGLLALILIRRLSPWYSFTSVVLLLLIAEFFPFDYDGYGILTVLASSMFLRFRAAGSLLLVCLPLFRTIAQFFSGLLSLQLYATLSIPIIALYNGERGAKLPRQFFYWFYPVHLLFLVFIWYFIQ